MSIKLPVYSPSKLNLFQRCPYAYWRRYIDRSMPSIPPTPSQIRGAVTHQILNLTLRAFRDGAGLPSDVSEQAYALLSEYEQLDPAQVVYETQSVSDHATFALDHFDTDCEVIMVEDNVEYIRQDRYRLMSRADAILRYPDGRFEFIDWKTGSTDYIDRIQSLILYIGAITYLKREYGADPDAISVTMAFLSHRKYDQVNTSREASKPIWEEIQKLIRMIQRSREWPAVTNPLCEYCALYGNGCPLESKSYLDMDDDD
jgi:RecB family exonuclease